MKHRKGPFSEDLRAVSEMAGRLPGPFRPAALGKSRQHLR